MQDVTISRLPDPSGFAPDALSDVIRAGARRLIEQAIEAELAALMAAFSGERLEDGRARLVRHGHLPEREVLTGLGPVAVKVPRLRDRGAGEEKITFTPSILPRYLRKAKSVEDLLPWLYLKGEEEQKTLRGSVFPTQGRVISPRRWRRCWVRARRGCLPRRSRG